MKFAFITTCMGRLAHAKISSRQLLSDERIDGEQNFYVFVDYCCPEQSADWIIDNCSKFYQGVNIRPRCVTVCRVLVPHLDDDQEVLFHKAKALNLGAERAIALGADYLVFLDVDCLVTTEFLDDVFRLAHQDEFLIMLPDKERKDLCGFLGVSRASFEKVGGFDLRMVGWGGEDLDMRLRLHLSGFGFREVPMNAHSISHGDELRTKFSPFDSKQASNHENLVILNQNVKKMTGKNCVDLMKEDPVIDVLLGNEKSSADNQTVHGMWIGTELSVMELLTMKSFVAMGHSFELWAYDQIITPLPEGVILRDASQIIPKEEVFRYGEISQGFGHGSYAGFSDIFRYKLLYEKGGWWSDMDVTCLKPLNFKAPYVFRPHKATGVVGNIMKCPAGSDLMFRCFVEANERVTKDNTDWYLPLVILSQHVNSLNLEEYIVSAKEFGLDEDMQWLKSSQTSSSPPLEQFVIHWCNEGLKHYQIDRAMPSRRSYYYELLTQYRLAEVSRP